ncbi:hypothetical protein [Micromonospora siamensis]|uniref:Uncharacterized protein n=1 Tax=Micromonospora siamensis TaxID=299152 RepID=A0A1C5H8Y5_9ACTN|nr:hypothetical protein [Micromonospora siamensis]SCG42450.1 hypothetical protein GA0074704_1272 [Micromonospora siamensis]
MASKLSLGVLLSLLLLLGLAGPAASSATAPPPAPSAGAVQPEAGGDAINNDIDWP